MRVLLLSNMYPSGASVSGIFVKRQLESLENNGVSVIKVVKKGSNIFSYFCFMMKSIYSVLMRRYDVIHAHYGFHSAVIPAILKRRPLVVTFHGSDALLEPSRNFLYRKLQKFTVSHSDRIIAVSDDIRKKLISDLCARDENIDIISCGVNTGMFRPMDKTYARKVNSLSPNGRIILFVGKISKMKGVDIIYECSVGIPDVLFVFVGSGVDDGFESRNCIFMGEVGNDKLPVIFNAADIFVLPSLSEGFPVVLMESLSCGIPVIASNVGGCSELVENGVNGYIFENNYTINNHEGSEFTDKLLGRKKTVDNFRRRVMQLLDDDDLRRRMGKNGRLKMTKEYNINIVAKKIISVYHSVC